MRQASFISSIVIAFLIPAANVAQVRPASATEFQNSSEREKRALLNDLAVGRRDMDSQGLAAILSTAMVDTDVAVRRSALGVVAARSGGVRFDTRESRAKQWEGDRLALQGLRPRITGLLEDPDQMVRRDAIIALGNLDFVRPSGGTDSDEITLREETVRTVAARYNAEASSMVRAEIVKTLALVANRSEPQQEVILAALNDAAAGVVQFAAMGSGRLLIPNALPRLADLMVSHGDRGVRLAAVQAIARYGRAAAEQLPLLRVALASESDSVVRQTIEGTISVLER